MQQESDFDNNQRPPAATPVRNRLSWKRFRIRGLLLAIVPAALLLWSGTQANMETAQYRILETNWTQRSDQRFDLHKVKYQIVRDGVPDERAVNLFLHPPMIVKQLPEETLHSIRYRAEPFLVWPATSLERSIRADLGIIDSYIDEIIEEDMRGFNDAMNINGSDPN